MHDTAFHVQIAEEVRGGRSEWGKGRQERGGLTRSHSFVAIVSLRTDFVPRSFRAYLNAHIAIVDFPLSPGHAIMYLVRVVSVVTHEWRVQYITKLHRPTRRRTISMSGPPRLRDPVAHCLVQLRLGVQSGSGASPSQRERACQGTTSKGASWSHALQHANEMVDAPLAAAEPVQRLPREVHQARRDRSRCSWLV